MMHVLKTNQPNSCAHVNQHTCCVQSVLIFHSLLKHVFHKYALSSVEVEHTLTFKHIFQVSPYKRVNVTYALYVYEGATVVLPTATVEFRQRLDQTGEHMPGDNCPSSFLVSNTTTIWGQLTANDAHMLIGTGDFKKKEHINTLLLSFSLFE